MTSRSDCEPLPKPTLSPFALARPGTFLRVGFFTAAVWCVPALRVPLVHSLINHFRKKRTDFFDPCGDSKHRAKKRNKRTDFSPPHACLSRCRGAGPSATQNS